MEILSTLGSGALNFILIAIAGLIFIIIVAGMTWFIMNKRLKEQYICYIINENGNLEIDKAGIYKDWKTKNRLFRLKKNKVGLSPDDVPYKQVGRKRYVFLYRTGLKRFHYINLNIEGEDLDYTITQEDLNWANEEHEKSKKAFQTTLLMQLLPIVSVAVVSVIILIMVIYVVKKFDVLLEISSNLKETATIIAQAKAGVYS
jgi:flagellar basal body-associated protein FliL